LENEVNRLVASVRGPVIGGDQLDLPNDTMDAEISEREISFDSKSMAEVAEETEHRMVEDTLKSSTGTNKRRLKRCA
jgi:hypothetical protein